MVTRMRHTPSSIQDIVSIAPGRVDGLDDSDPKQPGTAAATRTRPPFVGAFATIVFAAVGGLWLLASAWLLAGGGDAATQLLVADLVPPVLDFGAAALILLAAQRAGTRRATIAWSMVGISMVVYGLGDLLYAWFEVGLGEVPFPSLADVAYTAYYPIVVVALVSFPTVAANARERRRLAIDSAIVVIGGGMVVRAIVEIGRSLGMATVAEGIETEAQLERLRGLGCDLGQGFLLGRPVHSDVIADLVANPTPPVWAAARAV